MNAKTGTWDDEVYLGIPLVESIKDFVCDLCDPANCADLTFAAVKAECATNSTYTSYCPCFSQMTAPFPDYTTYMSTSSTVDMTCQGLVIGLDYAANITPECLTEDN